MRRPFFPGYLLLVILLSSCAGYKQNIMFRTTDARNIHQQASEAESNYAIRKNDLLQLDVYTNKGERIVDPNLESFKTAGQGSNTPTTAAAATYLVDINGICKLPLIGEIKLEGLTLRQAEEILQKQYAPFYEDPFVLLRFTNKRFIVLGSPGGQVLPLANEHVTLAEALAMAKGIGIDGKAHNIRVLRGEEIFQIDFSTVDGYLKSNIAIQPGDIVYVEPVRRPFSEALREYGPIISIITSVGTLVLVVIQQTK